MIDFMTFWPFRCPQITLFYFWWHFERENGHTYPLHKSTWNENWPKPFQNGLFHDDLIIISISSYSFSLHECLLMSTQLSRMFSPPFPFHFCTRYSRVGPCFLLWFETGISSPQKKTISIHSRPFRLRSLNPAFYETLPWLRDAGLYSSSECFVTWIFCVRN